MSFLKTTAIQHLNGSSPSIYLNSSGNVGIGNNSPAFALDVSGDVAVDSTMRFKRPGYTTWYATNYLGGYYLNNGADRFIVDSNGYVTKPYQPSFQVAKDDGGASLAGGQTILWNVISHNIGGNYNASTGRFTAPIAGRYYFSAFMLFGAGGTDTGQTFVFYINGSSSGYQPYTRSTGAQYVGMAGSVVFTLNAGDYVTVYIDAGGGPIYATGAKHNGFSGYLLG